MFFKKRLLIQGSFQKFLTLVIPRPAKSIPCSRLSLLLLTLYDNGLFPGVAERCDMHAHGVRLYKIPKYLLPRDA